MVFKGGVGGGEGKEGKGLFVAKFKRLSLKKSL